MREPPPSPGPGRPVAASAVGTVPASPARSQAVIGQVYRPSIRFAMMLCWISFEPAKIETLRLLK